MRVKIKILTPVHIGSGDSISPTGYFIDDKRGNFYFLNMDSLFQDPAFRPYKEKFIKEAGLSRYIGSIVPDQNLLKKHILYFLPASPDARKSNPIEIKAFIKSAGRPYVPGSSLKGAIISALLYFALKELWKDPRQKNIIINYLSTRGSKKEIERNYRNILDKAYSFLSGNTHFDRREQNSKGKLGYHSSNRSPHEGRFANLFDISDSNYLMPENSLKIEYSRVKGGIRGGHIPILYETLREGIEVEVDLVRKECGLEERKILEICHDFYLKVAAKDLGPKMVGFTDNPFLLRIGQGSTAFSTSFLILSEEVNLKGYRVKAPRTRKRLIDGPIEKPFGFVQMVI